MPAVSVGCSVTQPLPGNGNAQGPRGVEEVPLMGDYQEYRRRPSPWESATGNTVGTPLSPHAAMVCAEGSGVDDPVISQHAGPRPMTHGEVAPRE